MPDNELSADLRWPSPLEGSRPVTAPEPVDPPEDVEAPPVLPPRESGPRTAAPVEPAELVAAVDLGRLSRPMVEAYDRLADRVLERLRMLREDMDTDLTALRSEVASLRAAVDDVGDRVQLRQMRATLNELRGDVSALRRVILEWPELEQVSLDVGGLRADLTSLLELAASWSKPTPQLPVPPADLPPALEAAPPWEPDLSEIVATLDGEAQRAVAFEGQVLERLDGLAVASERLERAVATAASKVPNRADTAPLLAGLTPVIEGLSAVQTEVVALRRRIALRVGGEELVLTGPQIDALADAVTTRLLQHLRVQGGREV